MSLARDAERTVAVLLRKAQEAGTAHEAIALTDQAMKVATRHEIRVRRRFLTGGGVTGHYGRMDGARVALTAVLVLGVLGIVVWSLVLKDPGSVGQYASPVSGLAGICLGWLFSKDDGRAVRDAAADELHQRSTQDRSTAHSAE